MKKILTTGLTLVVAGFLVLSAASAAQAWNPPPPEQQIPLPNQGVQSLTWDGAAWIIAVDEGAWEIKVIEPSQEILCGSNYGKPCGTSYRLTTTADCIMVQVDWQGGKHNSTDPWKCKPTLPSSTPTPSATPTSTPTPSATPTPTPTSTPTVSPTPTPSSTPSPTPTPTSSPSATPTPTPTSTPSPTPSATPSATPTPSSTPSATPTPTSTPIASVTPSASPTPSQSAVAVLAATGGADMTFLKALGILAILSGIVTIVLAPSRRKS